MRNTLAVLTTGRQDYGILRSTVLRLQAHEGIRLSLWAGGMHLCSRFGRPIDLIRADGVTVARELNFVSDPPEAICHDTGAALAVIGEALESDRPSALMLVGDRTETLAAAMAATVCAVPVVHLHGGEETEGAIDNACRHAITKLSHLHLVSHASHATRVVQMGEPPESVHVVGAPGLDNFYRNDLPAAAEVARQLGMELVDPVVLVTIHPTTLGGEGDPVAEVRAVSQAMEMVSGTYVVSQPNADSGAEAIREHWVQWSAGRRNVALVDGLNSACYWALLRRAAAVVGNSSSGLIEAPIAGTPVINIGDRQKGRLRFGDITDLGADSAAIAATLRAKLSRAGERPMRAEPAYTTGPAAPRIVSILEQWTPPNPPRKRFRELGSSLTASLAAAPSGQ